ncbi:hypothetical protein BDY24DRAFT_388314 [Mrakia frigida]|uniref:uncharacterized protein n=1 Tax=Mrakia frigida TaxID=29902 RepID=UPI003FCBF533
MSSLAKAISSLSLSEEQLAHLTSYLSTFSGTDKALMILQYLPLVLLPLFPSDAPAGLPIRRRGGQAVAQGLRKLSSTVGDGRILFRLFGLVPILQWYSQLRKKRALAQKAKTEVNNSSSEDKGSWSLTRLLPNQDQVEMLQAYSMLAYYPLEHTYYLASKRIISLAPSKLSTVGIWSCRFWALYVALSLLSLSRRRAALSKEASSPGASRPELKKASKVLSLLTLVDLSYLPLTVHWSLPAGAWTSSFPTGVFGTIAALAQLKLGWEGSRAVAPLAPAPTPAPVAEAKLSTVVEEVATEEKPVEEEAEDNFSLAPESEEVVEDEKTEKTE